LFVILETAYSVNDFFFVWLGNPAFELPYNNNFDFSDEMWTVFVVARTRMQSVALARAGLPTCVTSIPTCTTRVWPCASDVRRIPAPSQAGARRSTGLEPVTLKMHDLKMTDKENYWSGKCRTGK